MSDGDHYFRFFVSDFLYKTHGFRAPEIGAYVVLICLMKENGGPLEHDAARLSRQCGASKGVLNKVVEELSRHDAIVLQDGRLWAPIIDRWDEMYERYRSRPAIPVAVREAVWQRDGECCAYCGSTDGPFHLDHIHPWSRGGAHSVDNLTVACVACNLSKRDRLLCEWEGAPQ